MCNIIFAEYTMFKASICDGWSLVLVVSEIALITIGKCKSKYFIFRLKYYTSFMFFLKSFILHQIIKIIFIYLLNNIYITLRSIDSTRYQSLNYPQLITTIQFDGFRCFNRDFMAFHKFQLDSILNSIRRFG